MTQESNLQPSNWCSTHLISITATQQKTYQPNLQWYHISYLSHFNMAQTLPVLVLITRIQLYVLIDKK